jgi:hypothetical protein
MGGVPVASAHSSQRGLTYPPAAAPGFDSVDGIESGKQGGEFTSAFGAVAEVHGRTASAAFDANDPIRTLAGQKSRSAATASYHDRRIDDHT